VVSVFRPFYGLLIYIFFAIVRPEFPFFWAMPERGMNFSKIVAVGMLAGWVLHGFGRWKFGRARGIVLGLMLFWFWFILSAAFSTDKGIAWEFIEVISKITLPVLVGFTLIDSTEKLRQLVWTIVLSEAFVGWSITSIYLSQSYLTSDQLEDYTGLGRALLGTAFASTLPPALFLFFTSKAVWQKGLAALCLAMIGHGIFLTFSRGALLGTLAGLTVFFLMVPQKGRYIWALPVIVALGFLMSGPEVWSRFATTFADKEERDESAQGRVDLWHNCLELIKEAPIVGVGPDHFKLVSTRFGWDKPKEAHNLWLQMAAEIGLPGLLGLAMFFGLTALGLVPLIRRGSDDPWIQFAAVGTVAGLAAFFVCSWFVTVVRLETPWYLTLFGGGLIKLASATPRRPSRNPIDAPRIRKPEVQPS
jgi:O-antigen ligase